ncbi:1-aminocyclopropane-1-carboxylate oxidase -like protein 3 [Capsicum chinense]|nr:1-aminocyclopropane-1-carboxylate oxidase -like protein 3 [Capsicum chinense]
MLRGNSTPPACLGHGSNSYMKYINYYNGSTTYRIKKMDTSESKYDRKSELEAFDDTKAGVKGLVDAGLSKVPQIFISPPNKSTNNSNPTTGQFIFPVIDLEAINYNQINRKKVVEEVRDASETWGFFQVINHGIPSDVLEEMIQGARSFHEQDTEIKKQWYTREFTKKVVYNSNFDLYSAPATNWRDTFFCIMAPNPPSFEELPQICRDIIVKYSEEVKKLGRCLFELLAEALGLNTSHLKDMDCDKGLSVVCHYYPACPEPELTLGASKHADDGFLTLLLQDHIGGLQVLHDNRWVDVPPTPGALVVNIADLLQLISNDKFNSVEHRVLANKVGPRVSMACFFTTSFLPTQRMYGPISELISEHNPPNVRFTGKNFSSWEFQFQLFVTGKELWGHIDGADPAPTDPTKLGEWKIKDARDYYSGFQNLWAKFTDIVYAKIPSESLSVIQQKIDMVSEPGPFPFWAPGPRTSASWAWA